MKTRYRSTLLQSLLCLHFAACAHHIAGPGTEFTDIEMETAQILAQCARGDVYPQSALAVAIASDLRLIRQRFGHDYPEIIDVQRTTTWGELLFLTLTDETYEELEAGTYSAWNRFNEMYKPLAIIRNPSAPEVTLKFHDGLNLCALGSKYVELPGIKAFDLLPQPGGSTQRVDLSEIGGDRYYLFFNGWDDCALGCIHWQQRLFKVRHSRVLDLGIRTSEDQDVDWWREFGGVLESSCCPAL